MTLIFLLFATLLTNINCENNTILAPSLFLNHGGGPYPVLGEEFNKEIRDSLKNVSSFVDLKRLNAVIVVTAHREEDVVTISSGDHHDMLYDYYNFPPISYTFKHNAPGDPVLAGRIHEAFKKVGIPSKLDSVRGWDHGVFIPMMLVDPDANIPIVQVSILKNQDAAQHFEIGKVLYQFRKEGVAVFGSGMSYHNMGEFKKAESDDNRLIVNDKFDEFLNEVCTGDADEMKDRLTTWMEVPGGLESHPLGEADHLMPLIVNAGAGGAHPGTNIFKSVFIYKFRLSGFIWDKE
ncbi:uncharacterized protein LOC113510137 [Galleria mellonella]|uniref:Uncharacterized protein LOC113510137 n=1 Tax=Galleria mellonella TaxID=7137 RepID=A0A6J1W8T9_GALME|nr:uncharacterized protein LOC113510137 [Galleria mellonella]